jgi:uncharacterized protein with beta-barrel porin domain
MKMKHTRGTHALVSPHTRYFRRSMAFLTLCLSTTAGFAADFQWTGVADTDWFNAANWIPSTGAATTTPNGAADTTSHYVSAQRKTIDMFNTGAADQTVTVSELLRLDTTEGFTMNVGGKGSGKMVFVITGNGFNRSSTSDIDAVVNVGNNAILRYTKANDNNNPGRNWADVRLSGNALLDISAVAHTNRTGALVELSKLRSEAGTTVNLGINALRFGALLNYGSTVIAGSIVGSPSAILPGTGSVAATARGRIQKSGNGTTILTGVNTFDTSPFTPTAADNVDNHYSAVLAGTLVVNSNLGHVRILSSDTATLAGNGTVGNVLLQRGRLSAGMGANDEDVGTLTINGNLNITGNDTTTSTALYTAGTASTQLVVDFGKNGLYDRINVTGSTTIAGANSVLRVNIPAAELYAGNYTVLSSAGGITGSFSAAYGPSTLTIGYSSAITSNSIILSLTQKPFAAVAGLSPSQMTIANYLDSLAAQGTLGNPSSYDRLVGIMNGKASYALLTSAMNQLTPQIYGNIYLDAIANTNFVTDALQSRTDPRLETKSKDFSFYATGGYDASETRQTADVDMARLHSTHAGVGVEKQIGPSVVVGGHLDTVNGQHKLDTYASEAENRGYTGSLYATYYLKAFALGGAVFYGVDRYDFTRDVSQTRFASAVTAEIDAKRLGAAIWGEYSIKTKWLDIKPYASTYFLWNDVNAFTESGRTSVALRVRGLSDDAIRSKAGVRLQTEIKADNTFGVRFLPFMDIGWTYDWNSESRILKAVLRDVDLRFATPEYRKSGIRGSAGLAVAFRDRIKIEIGAAGQFDGIMKNQFSYQGFVGYRF